MVGESGICDVFVELIVARGLMGIRGSKPQEAIQNKSETFIWPYVWFQYYSDQRWHPLHLGVWRPTWGKRARVLSRWCYSVEVRIMVVPVELAYQCDELFICTNADGIMPITSIDDQSINNGPHRSYHQIDL